MSKIITWKTNIVKAGYQFTVSEMIPRSTVNSSGQYSDTKVLKQGIRKTRARARGIAVKYVRYYRQVNKEA